MIANWQMHKVRILMLMASPFKSGAAPENFIRAKAVFNDPANEVDLICFPIGEDIEQSNLNIRRIPKHMIFKSYQIGDYKKILVYTLSMIFKLIFKQDKKYNVIFLFNASYLFFWLIKPLFRGKVVAMVYAPLEGEIIKWNISRNKLFFSLVRKYEKFILSKYDRLVFNIVRIQHVFENEGYRSDKLVLIPHACESYAPIARDYAKDGVFKILYAGSFVRVQNITLIYQVASLLKEYKKIRFDLVGANEEEFANEIKKIEELSLANVFIHQRVSNQDLSVFYKNANMLISCRVQGEDLPFKIIEYMSWGKCILATDRPIHNLVLNRKIACLVEPEPEIMVKKLLNLYKNPDQVKQFEKNVSQYFKENHSFEMMQEKYKKLINELNSPVN